jgi:RNAse (barnase) inhibitor barstar
MRVLRIYTRDWASEADVIQDVLVALQAPKWLGRDVDALWDSITADNINGVRAPFHIIFANTARASHDAEQYMARLDNLFHDIRARGLEVKLSRHCGR